MGKYAHHESDVLRVTRRSLEEVEQGLEQTQLNLVRVKKQFNTLGHERLKESVAE